MPITRAVLWSNILTAIDHTLKQFCKAFVFMSLPMSPKIETDILFQYIRTTAVQYSIDKTKICFTKCNTSRLSVDNLAFILKIKRVSWTCSILLTITMHLILFANIFFISSRAACENLAENSKNSIDLRVTHTCRQLLQNLRLLVRRQLHTTMSNITVIKLDDRLRRPSINIHAFATSTSCCDLDLNLQNLIRSSTCIAPLTKLNSGAEQNKALKNTIKIKK